MVLAIVVVVVAIAASCRRSTSRFPSFSRVYCAAQTTSQK